MKTKFVLPLLILILASLACNAVLPQAEPTTIPLQTQPQPDLPSQDSLPPLTEDQVPRISVSDAKAAVDSGAAILVDVRSADAYAEGHAAGAVSIPLINFENNIGSLSLEKSQWIITYCT